MHASSEYSSELLRNVLQYLARAMLAMGIFALLSGGVCAISSSLVIAMAHQLLRATSARGSLQEHLSELALLRDKDCRGCCRNCCSGMCRGLLDNARGLAIAAITFGVLELLIYVIYFGVLGWLFTDFYYPYSQSSRYDVVSTREFSCYAGSNDYCTISYHPTFLYQYYSFQCYAGGASYCYATLPDTIYNNNNAYTFYDGALAAIGRWLLYAVGNTAIAAPLNVAWGALTLNLIGVLTIAGAGSEYAAGETTALLSRVAVPVFMSGAGKPEPAAEGVARAPHFT
jgi:hypothetical protein